MNAEAYTKKDFVSSAEVKWCSGCGDFSVLSQVQKAMAETGADPDNTAFVSGIGCSSRFPYYMNTFGFHTIHGRALAVATGVKTANPDLNVWVTIGDGDGVSIGGNHFIHTIRRNLDIVCVIMDNRIYGLTKGQFSPTSLVGQITKTSPYGKLEAPMDIVSLALGAGCSFVARTIDRNPKHMQAVLQKAAAHKGFSLVHVLQNCVIFNDGTFNDQTGPNKQDNSLMLEHGKPMVFGKEGEKAIIIDGFDPKVVNTADVAESELLIHDENMQSVGQAMFLGAMADIPGMPIPMGVMRQSKEGTYDAQTQQQLADVAKAKGQGDLQTLLNSGDTWTV